MYSNDYASQRSKPVELSNNPFLSHPSNPYTRFPDMSASSSSQSPPPQFSLGYGTGYGDQAQHQAQAFQYQQQQQQQYLGGYSAPPQIQHQGQFASTSYTPQYSNFSQPNQLMSQPTGFGFQPTSAFGQQLQQYALQTGHPGNGQQYASEGYPQQPNPSYLSEFDPYAQRSTSPSYPQIQGAAASGGTYAKQHPRDFLRSNKAEIERWDPYAWKQLINACDALRDAWTDRKQHAERTLQQYGGDRTPFLFGQGYNDQLLEGWRQAMKVAESNGDTITACTFQLQEVFNGYRQSSDPGSKRRVREACNAAIAGLPDWPSPLS